RATHGARPISPASRWAARRCPRLSARVELGGGRPHRSKASCRATTAAGGLALGGLGTDCRLDRRHITARFAAGAQRTKRRRTSSVNAPARVLDGRFDLDDAGLLRCYQRLPLEMAGRKGVCPLKVTN